MQKKTHIKKLAAPIVIAVLLVAYYIGFAVVCAVLGHFSTPVMVILGVVPLSLAGVCIWMLAERFKEIRSGEEDDLSQY